MASIKQRLATLEAKQQPRTDHQINEIHIVVLGPDGAIDDSDPIVIRIKHAIADRVTQSSEAKR